MTHREKRCRFSYFLSKLVIYAFECGYEVSFQDVFAHDGHCHNSLHYVGLAGDLNLYLDGKYLTETKDYEFLGKKWRQYSPNCTWGGDWDDGCHFSYGEGIKNEK